MQKARANIYVYSSARISGLIFEHEKTVGYEELSHVMWYVDYTTNCEICGTKSSRNRRRCRKHERTSTYTAVRHLPVSFLKTKWYVYHELLGMWYELKQRAEDAKSTSEHLRTQQCANFRFNLWTRKNCMIPGTLHDVHDRSDMMW